MMYTIGVKYILLFLSILSFIGLKQKAYAETSVNIKTNGNSSSHVNVVSKTSSTNGNTTSSNHVTIENNGEVKSFDTEGDDSVDWTSDDGKSTVKINSKTVTSSPTATTTPKPSKDEEDTPSSSAHEEKKTEKISISQLLKTIFQNIFPFFHF